MSVIAVYNSKGGTGKTTSAVNLACVSALGGTPTLLWDLDPQGAASFYLGQDQGLDHSAKKLLSGKKDWQSEVRATGVSGLSLIPGDGALRNWDLLLEEQSHARRVLHDWLKPLRRDFPTIILDCPPGLTLLSENLFRAADAIAVPVVPSTLGFRTLDHIREFLAEDNRLPPIVLPFLSLADRRRRDHRELAENPPPGFLRTVVPMMAEIERTGGKAGIPALKPKNRSAEIYRSLWLEIQAGSQLSGNLEV